MSLAARPSFLQRYLLPGFAFQSVVVGGGYATGRELIEFFLPAGPWGGLLGIVVTTGIFSIVCAITFELARAARAFDYRSFFRLLLGRGWVAFELCYVASMFLVLSVAGAACGAIAERTFGFASSTGVIAFSAVTAAAVITGSRGVEAIFKYWSLVLYATYALFLFFCITSFGERIEETYSQTTLQSGWLRAGVTYSGYNVTATVLILYTVRFAMTRRDAFVSGLLAGPLAMLPAAAFFVAMAAFYPGIGQDALPSTFLLEKLPYRWFEWLYQLTIFGAIADTGVALIHALNERLDTALKVRFRPVRPFERAGVAVVILLLVFVVANGLGLITLIASGYGTLTWVALAVYVVPVLTVGLWQLAKYRAV